MVSVLLAKYNEKYSDNLSIEDITDYQIHKFLKPECTNIFKEFADDELFCRLVPEPQAVNVISELNKRHLVYYVTAGHPSTMKARDKWLSKHFNPYNTRQLINCRDKCLLKLDVLVDDAVHNLIPDKEIGVVPTYEKICFDSPWNRNFDCIKQGIYRVHDFAEIDEIIKRLEKKE